MSFNLAPGVALGHAVEVIDRSAPATPRAYAPRPSPEPLTVRITRIHPAAAVPDYHTKDAAGFDLAAVADVTVGVTNAATEVGGIARYEDDAYHRISEETSRVPGNPWIICTLWLADYFITRAKSIPELKRALPIFEWTAAHALESGVLAEQVNPDTNEPISVSPLTWSHATVVSTSIKYLEKLESRMKKIIKAKAAGKQIRIAEEPKKAPAAVKDLMEILKQSLSTGGSKKRA